MKSSLAPKTSLALGQTVRLNNLEIYYEEHGNGSPLVLLHGFGGCTQNWHPFINELSKHYRLIAVDLRGHGYSTNPENQFTHRQAAIDVLQLLDTLDIKTFSAMGMSTGGMALLHMATMQPKRIESMVLISATSSFPDQARYIMRRASYSTMPKELQAMYKECAKRGDEQIQQLITQFNALHNNYDDVNFTPQILATITAKALIIHGDRDNFFPVEIAVEIYRSIPNAALWIVPEGDHVPIYNPTTPFTTIALRFLKEVKHSR